MTVFLRFSLVCLLIWLTVALRISARTIEFTTTEVTEADVTLSPDGQWLILTMLGHLFRLPVEGGTAEQLTFGPYYDNDPMFSPDGKRVAFVSDRDGSEGNIFVLELATGQITQVTHEPWAGRPVWTPDGQAIVYLSFLTPGVENYSLGFRWMAASVRRISIAGGGAQTLTASPRIFRSVFYLPDGRLAWAVIERDGDSRRWKTQVEVVGLNGEATILRTLAGYVDRVVVSPSGDGLYCRRYLTLLPDFPFGHHEYLLFVPLAEGVGREITAVSGFWWRAPRFALAADNKSVYLGDEGQIWRVALPEGFRERVAFSAAVTLEVQDTVAPRKSAVALSDQSIHPDAVVNPKLSPDGRTLVFVAAGYLWRQGMEGGPAQRLLGSSGIDQAPAFSPDGRELAFVHTEHGTDEIRIFNFENRQTRTLASGLMYWGATPRAGAPMGAG